MILGEGNQLTEIGESIGTLMYAKLSCLTFRSRDGYYGTDHPGPCVPEF